jgi:hypothetical protein
MVERHKIQHGTRLRLLRQRDGVAFGALGRVDTIREENWGTAWGFSVYWDNHRKKNRYSLFFTEADLEPFEILIADTAKVVVKSFCKPRRSSEQLDLPFTRWILYRGSDAVDSFETWR